MNSDPVYAPQSPIITGLLGRCPRCGLDYGFADAGDGPAVFVSLLGGFIVLGASLWTELAFEPPFWVHLVIFLPLTLIVCLGLLRPLKGMLIAQQFRTKAEQGRLQN